MIHSKVTVVFCGEEYSVSPETGLTIGRTGDVEVDDNPYLHRTFLVVSFENGFWWISNTGSTLTATVADEQGLFQAWLNPGAKIPLAMKKLIVWFTAGPTTYDFEIHVASPAFRSVTADAPAEPPSDDEVGAATVGRVSFTPDQKLLVVALCEPFLRRRERVRARYPPRPPPPNGSAGPSPVSTASSTTSARSLPTPARAACTAASASSRPTARRGSSSTPSRPSSSRRATSPSSTTPVTHATPRHDEENRVDDRMAVAEQGNA